MPIHASGAPGGDDIANMRGATSRFHQSQTPKGSFMKGWLTAAGIIAALYFADQYFAQGRYTDALEHMINQMRHSFGV